MNLLGKLTIIFTFVLWIVVDILLTQQHAPTLSAEITQYAKTHTILPYLIGFICGHWFITAKRPWVFGWMWSIPIFVGLIVWDLFASSVVVWYRHPTIWFPIGVVLGYFLWSQSDGESPL